MSICYSDERDTGAPVVPYHRLNAVKGYLRHYENYLMLSFLAQNSHGAEKHQALKELRICERKLDWWKKHPSYDITAITEGCAKLKAAWRSR